MMPLVSRVTTAASRKPASALPSLEIDEYSPPSVSERTWQLLLPDANVRAATGPDGI